MLCALSVVIEDLNWKINGWRAFILKILRPELELILDFYNFSNHFKIADFID